MYTSAEVLHLTRTINAQYAGAAACTLTFFDWIICFNREAKQIRAHRCTPASLLYYVNRYSGLACSLSVILELSLESPQHASCLYTTALQIVSLVTSLLVLIAVAIFSAMRVYVMCKQNKIILL
ncbi:hypothetical protein C8Q74DRAFT_245058 [Fomes fomentarius]|nr:hypothetical protein C8Q74DRAFT_245058 [Fomes fomentarius]